MSRRHQEGLAHLLYGINSGGFVVLTGEVGTGKTTLCHGLLQQLPDDVDIALILNPKLNSLELLANICDELGIDYNPEKAGLKDFTDLLNTYLLDAHARGRRTVLLIDEAQNLSMEVLEQIRLLTNLETSKTKLLQIVLVGQPELKRILSQKELRQLNQRITARYHLEPLDLEETQLYIKHRLVISGGEENVFKKSAIKRIYTLSQGIPRLINLLCDRALLGAYASGVKTVTPKIVEQAAKEVLESENKPYRRISLLFFLLILVTAGLFMFNLNPSFFSSVFTDKAIVVAENRTKTETPVEEAPIEDFISLKAENILSPEKFAIPSLPTAKERAPETTAENFSEYISNPELSFENAFAQALALWGEKAPHGKKIDCDSLKQKGLRCLIDHGSLKDVLKYNRPAVLEFSLPDGRKRHALLIGMDRGYPIIRSVDGKDLTFPLEEVLKFWQGYYLILWKSPLIHNMKGIYPGQASPNVLWLRKQMDRIDGQDSIDVPQPDVFDTRLEDRVKTFQKLHGLQQDSIVGSRTMIILQNSIQAENFPKLKYLK